MNVRPSRPITTMNRLFRAIQIACGLMIVLAAFMYFAVPFGLSLPTAQYIKTPLTRQQFQRQFGTISQLPDSASNIFFAKSSVGFTGFVELYRFDAPVEDCLEHAKYLSQVNRPKAKEEVIPLESNPQPISQRFLKAYGLEELDWFDIENIPTGFEGHLPVDDGRPAISFWIDANRGRFYYFSSD